MSWRAAVKSDRARPPQNAPAQPRTNKSPSFFSKRSRRADTSSQDQMRLAKTKCVKSFSASDSIPKTRLFSWEWRVRSCGDCARGKTRTSRSPRRHKGTKYKSPETRVIEIRMASLSNQELKIAFSVSRRLGGDSHRFNRSAEACVCLRPMRKVMLQTLAAAWEFTNGGENCHRSAACSDSLAK